MNAQDAGAIVSPAELGRVHFIGIGGAGMSGIARIMLSRGIAVSGSDAKESVAADVLRGLGAQVSIGHDPAHLGEADTVVVSSAIREDNPELAAARSRNLRVIHRSAALASLMLGRRAIAIAGTHGKTTTTSMTTVALQHCGIDPSFAIGGVLSASGANAQDGTGDVFVAEADESDGSFLLYTPTVGVITNVEADHLDHYGSAEAVVQAFDAFCLRVRDTTGGTVVACGDDPGARDVAERARAAGVEVLLYGTGEYCDVRVVDLGSSSTGATFGLVVGGLRIGEVELQQPGAHNALNAAAAFSVGHLLGLPSERVLAGLALFGGTRRRFELRGEARGVRVYDDYAHHPTEVTAVLKAARGVLAPGGRVIAVFQPHLYSRTLAFTEEFARALSLADHVVVLDIYAAREDPVPGVTGAVIADRVDLPEDRRHFQPSFLDAAGQVAGLAQPGDVVLTIGAGDVTVLGPEVLKALG
ncbi:UDP-N-acetylmuramate--L-alanine ligase [Sediminivirga luteola]|uniref:UDP-N-acetylmuramate--L-alanine ligase n=1 Tax=Sediminivirga luteola TaxID=1774748 RepID=A0A8J2TZQ0_9MICO|nr:UDP-N-acetylmuramate--L-alanine ligase [Sediminivirga luteola]GGA21073.1 UDP-N-acetylmuramate--L-alanine ligase [Sediminivirga luteola]